MSKKKILIVEDDPDTQALLKKRLGSIGFDCISAFTVESALNLVQETSPNLVILDLGFAGANGTAFLNGIKDRIPEGVDVPPIIVLSGYNDREIVEYALDSGAKGFLAKPVDTEMLLNMVGEYIQ